MNKIILSGGITRDAELSFIGSTGTPKMSFSLAVERGYQKDKNNTLADVLNEQGEEDYMSFKVQDTLCRIIQEANRVNTYIRHYKDK